MPGLTGAAVFWLAGHYLLRDDAGAPEGLAWMVMILLALSCGLMHWYGDYDRWVDRIAHLAGLLGLVAVYAVYWEGFRAAAGAVTTDADARWPLVTWLIFGLALPLGMALLAPARVLLEGRGYRAGEDYDDVDDD